MLCNALFGQILINNIPLRENIWKPIETRTTLVVSNGRYTFYQIPFIKSHLSNTIYQIPFIKYLLSNTIYQIIFAVKNFFNQ